MGLSNHGEENAPSRGSSKEEDLTRMNSAGEEKEPQTKVEDVVLFILNSEATGRTTRYAKQQKARRPPTKGSDISGTLPRSPAHDPYYPPLSPRSPSR